MGSGERYTITNNCPTAHYPLSTEYTHKSWGTDLTGFRNLSGLPQNVGILLSTSPHRFIHTLQMLGAAQEVETPGFLGMGAVYVFKVGDTGVG